MLSDEAPDTSTPGPIEYQNQIHAMKVTKILLTTLALAATTAALSAADANENWDKNCKKCHGDDGTGQTAMGKKLELKDFTDAKYQDTFKDADAIKAIKEGIKDGDKTKMKAAEGLTDDEIKALVAKVRSFKK
jgi:cytochrome c553